MLPNIRGFDDRSRAALAKLNAIHGSWAVDAVLRYTKSNSRKPVSHRKLTELSNMRPERSADILQQLADGTSLTHAEKTTKGKGIIDTHGWGEVAGRLGRGRGQVLASAAILAVQRNTVIQCEAEQKFVTETAMKLKVGAARVLRLMSSIPTGTVNEHNSDFDDTLYDAKKTATYGKLQGMLNACVSYLDKIERDIPRFSEKVDSILTLERRARCNVQLAWIGIGADLLVQLGITANSPDKPPLPSSGKPDLLGVGQRYSPWLNWLAERRHGVKTIATHKEPDADALVAAWLVERYLFADETCQVHFVARGYEPSDATEFDCVLDVGRQNRPERLWFDHKPPAFNDRNDTCATRLVCDHLRRHGRAAEPFKKLVDLVHDGDAPKRRGRSSAYRESRKNGLHAHIKHVTEWAENDQVLYQAVAMWLDTVVSK